MNVQVRIAQEGLRDCEYCRTYDADELVSVRDVSSRLVSQVAAKELSVYRHILFVDGWGYRIVGITKTKPSSASAGR